MSLWRNIAIPGLTQDFHGIDGVRTNDLVCYDQTHFQTEPPRLQIWLLNQYQNVKISDEGQHVFIEK